MLIISCSVFCNILHSAGLAAKISPSVTKIKIPSMLFSNIARNLASFCPNSSIRLASACLFLESNLQICAFFRARINFRFNVVLRLSFNTKSETPFLISSTAVSSPMESETKINGVCGTIFSLILKAVGPSNVGKV